MISKTVLIGAAAALALFVSPAAAKDKVKVSFIGPLTGGTAANGIGGRNSADLAVKLRNADAKAKYEYQIRTAILDFQTGQMNQRDESRFDPNRTKTATHIQRKTS